MKPTYAGHALVLNNLATPTDQTLWSYLYTPTIEVAETSCLGFYTKLMRYSGFQVQLVWSESRTIYKPNGTETGINKVNTDKLEIEMINWLRKYPVVWMFG